MGTVRYMQIKGWKADADRDGFTFRGWQPTGQLNPSRHGPVCAARQCGSAPCVAPHRAQAAGETQPAGCDTGARGQLLLLRTMVTPPTQPCLYLKVQQEVLMRTPVRDRFFSCRKSYLSSNDQQGGLLSTDSICSAPRSTPGENQSGLCPVCMNVGYPASKGT